MNKPLRYFLLITIFIAIVSTISYCSFPYDTETAQTITVRESVTGSGFLLRKETLVENTANAVFESSVKDGARVSKGSPVGVAISGNLSEQLATELEEVTKRIEEIKDADSIAGIYSSDEARVFSAMKDITTAMRNNAYDENFSVASENASALSSLFEKKFSAENQTSADKLLVSLEERKYNLEQQLGGIREKILAPASGYFYTALDGLEKMGDEKTLSALLPVEINSFSQKLKNYESDRAVAKVTDTYVWYLAAAIPSEEAELLKKDASVLISIDESPLVNATVLAVNPDETGESAIIIKCNKNIVGLFEKRTVEFEICTKEFSGLYVPAEAIRVVDGVTGVYTMRSNKVVTFKCVDVLYHEKDFYIVRNKFSPSEKIPFEPLKLYDNILVNPEAIKFD